MSAKPPPHLRWPWRETSRSVIRNYDGQSVCTFDLGIPWIKPLATEANIRYTVKAVNNHHKLVEVCTTVLEYLMDKEPKGSEDRAYELIEDLEELLESLDNSAFGKPE